MRESWDDYFMGIAMQVSSRSTCPRASVGAVIIQDNRIIGTGYNGSVAGHPHCTDVGCYIVGNHCVRTIHAEVNALLTALERGRVDGATVYCTHYPCIQCSKLLVQAGIRRIVYGNDYSTPIDEMEFRAELDIESERWYTPE